MSPSAILLVALLIVYAAPYLAWRLLRTDGVAPLVVVQIVAGLLLGPGLFGALAPGWYGAIFTARTLDSLGAIATLAVVLFVWAAGVELDLRDVRATLRESATAAGLAIAGPLLAGTAAACVLLRHDGWIGAQAAPWQAACGIGMACAVTALPILVVLLERLHMLRTPLGRRALRIASFDDILIWGVLAIILLDRARLERQIAFLAVFALCAMAMRRLVPRLPERDRWPVALVWLTACACAADWAELHFMVGAFMAGAVLDRDWLGEARTDMFRDMVLTALMPVFFLNTGLHTDWRLGGGAILGAAALLLVAAVGGKLAGVGLAGRLLRWPRGEAAVIGLLLQTKALVMIIFSRVLLDRHVISDAAFTALLLMAVASTLLTMPAVRYVQSRLPDLPGARRRSG